VRGAGPRTGIVAAAFAITAWASTSAQQPLASSRVEEARFVTLGGIEQWITVRGDDARSPVLLLVHGGPGDVQSPLVSTYARYERDFVLVQWDQRGAGKTYGQYGDRTPDLTLERVVEDGIDLAEQLRSRFESNGIVLVGHSWGTAIATEMVLQRPDLFVAYVGTGQIASWAENVQAQFEFLKAKAVETGDAAWLAELDAIGQPDPKNAAQYFGFTRPLRQHLNASDTAWLVGLRDLAQASPLLSAADIEALRAGMTFSGRTLWPTQIAERLSSTALRFELPYCVIQGRADMFTPTEPALAYFEKIRAPRKHIAVIEDAGHFALATHPVEFIAAVHACIDSGSCD
jgi:pimeloyl-ACP methyl ester carboxylesterase